MNATKTKTVLELYGDNMIKIKNVDLRCAVSVLYGQKYNMRMFALRKNTRVKETIRTRSVATVNNYPPTPSKKKKRRKISEYKKISSENCDIIRVKLNNILMPLGNIPSKTS